MDMESMKLRALLSWGWSTGLLAVLCCVLAVVQYRWINESSRAQQDRLRGNLQSSLNRLSRDFNSEITIACAALLPTGAEIEAMGRGEAYAARYTQWKDTGARSPLFHRMALAIPRDGDIVLEAFDAGVRRFSTADWPEAWLVLRDRLRSKLTGGTPGPAAPADSLLIEVPRFGRPDKAGAAPRMSEQEWLIVEINLDYVRAELIPQLIQRHLSFDGKLEYATEIFVRANPSNIIYSSGSNPNQRISDNTDGSVTLFDVFHPEISRRSAQGQNQGQPEARPHRETDAGRGRWQMLVRHQSGSLHTMVSRARQRNLALSAALLLLMLAAVASLVRSSRQAQKLAELQMNFVAGVSHELRTPLTVIRTAAFNLKEKVATHPAQVEKYGSLIQAESEKLTALVEQVLRFASARSGRVIFERRPVSVESLIEEGLQTSGTALKGDRWIIEKYFAPGLSMVLADEMALKQAIQNVLDNAVKYGMSSGSSWIRVSAVQVTDAAGAAVEIRVADRGPGIPHDEQKHIFDPFFRGRRAVQDQIHGTGLGLNLVKRIVEAHGGTVTVKSQPKQGTEFIIRIPAAPPELRNEFAHSSG